MYPPGHIGITVILFVPLVFAFCTVGRNRAGLGWLSLACVLTLLPDVDALLPGIVHRGVTHTLLAAVVLGAVVAAVGLASGRSSLRIGFERAVVGFLVGSGAVVSHLLGDVITPMGVRPMFPLWNTAYTLDLVYASDPRVNLTFLLTGGTVLALTYHLQGRAPVSDADEPDVAAEESATATGPGSVKPP